MNKENASKLWKIIQEAGDYLNGQLPEHPNHPKGRNPYAHVAICVKSKFQKSYKDIEDAKFPRNMIEHLNSEGYKMNEEELDGKSVRLVAAWNTQEEDVDGLLETLKKSN